MQYAHVRVSSVLDKTEINVQNARTQEFHLKEKEEKILALHILKFADALDSSLQELMPSRICDYLYMLCTLFNEFYGSCKVIGDGHFLRSGQTLEKMKSEYFYPGILDRKSQLDWKEEGYMFIRGKGSMTLTYPDGKISEFSVSSGDIVLIEDDVHHRVENTGNEEKLYFVCVFDGKRSH